jgi:prepilin signal peptidase PulO-like enzyme (type II secretory pathway)
VPLAFALTVSEATLPELCPILDGAGLGCRARDVDVATLAPTAIAPTRTPIAKASISGRLPVAVTLTAAAFVMVVAEMCPLRARVADVDDLRPTATSLALTAMAC